MYEISLFHKFNETWQILLSFTNTLCYKSPRICSTCRKHFPVLCSFITGFVTRLKRRVPPVEQELPTLPEHLSSPPVFSVVCVTRSFVVCPFVLFLLVIVLSVFWSLCCLSFGHCVVCLLAIVLSVLRFTDSDYPFGIFELFLLENWITYSFCVNVEIKNHKNNMLVIKSNIITVGNTLQKKRDFENFRLPFFRIYASFCSPFVS